MVSDDVFDITSNEKTPNSVKFPPAIIHSILSSIPTGVDNATLEVAISGQTGAVFHQRADKLSVRLRQHQIFVRSKTSQDEFLNATDNNLTIAQKNTISVQSDKVILNAKAVAIVAGVDTFVPTGMAIGGSSASNNIFYGQIYSIRYYNRRLTDTEIYYNQQVDNVRFQLGLDLTGGIVPYVPNRSLSLSRTITEDDDE